MYHTHHTSRDQSGVVHIHEFTECRQFLAVFIARVKGQWRPLKAITAGLLGGQSPWSFADPNQSLSKTSYSYSFGRG